MHSPLVHRCIAWQDSIILTVYVWNVKNSQWCHVSHVCNAVMVACLPCCHVSNYVKHSITMNDRCLVGWMVTDDTIHVLGTLFMAIHMMEVLKELSPVAIGMFCFFFFFFFFGGGGGEATGFIGPVEVTFVTLSMGGALTCCLGVGAFLDCFWRCDQLATQLG